MKISKEHRDALNEALDETAGYEGDVYVFDVKHIEILRSAVIAMLEDDEQIATVAPAVDAQPVGEIAHNEIDGFHFAPSVHWLMIGIGTKLYATPQSWGLRKDAEELLRRIPTTPEQMIDFIGSHFDSMEAQEWSEFSGEARAKPAGDLSMVRYSLTVHDLLSAFDWADLSEYAIDAALSQHTGEKDD